MNASILITGAGSGIGRAIAIVLSKKLREIPLILTGRNLNKLEETRLTLFNSQLHQIHSLDVADHSSIIALKSHLLGKQLTLSSLILNAGIGGENSYGSEDRWSEILATNLTGPYQITQELLPLFKKDQCSFKSIVFISSILARLGVPKYSAYCASKAGLLGLMRSLAAELASEKILVNAICPGWVDTEMSTQGLEGIAHGNGKLVSEVREEQMSMVPLKKMSRPDEVAELVHFLVSGVQTSITGQAIDINNGALML